MSDPGFQNNFLRAELLTKRFPSEKRGSEDLTVFQDVSFNVKKGEFVCCIGHSGCGKSTILNILSGLEPPTEGVALLNQEPIDRPGLNKAVVFQNHSLLPWLSALRNVQFAVGAKHRDWSKHKVREHSLKFLEMCSLKKAVDRKPHQLSGGMRQRVGLARAFALESELLLMDEPFGALDALTRGTIQDELVRICEQTKQTVFMITHDVDEAILLSDRIFLMTNGPYATIAEAVVIDLPRPRDRATLFEHPSYYKIRNHILDFLVNRCKEARPVPSDNERAELSFPPEVHPGQRDNDNRQATIDTSAYVVN
ncbi:MAG: ABC transporter ATP-binding protein [Verrucomicrobiota bacterium]